MEEPSPEPKVDIADVGAIQNIDTARMALRWALERMRAVEKAKGDNDDAFKKVREELAAMKSSLLSKEQETREREAYYSKMEELLSLRLSGKLDVEALVKEQSDTQRLREFLVQKEAELDEAYRTKLQNLELERQRVGAEAERKGIEETAKAEENLRHARQSLEKDHSARLAALREQEARIRREAEDLASRQSRFEEFYSNQRVQLDKDIQRFRAEVDDEVKFRVQSTEQLLGQRHQVIESAWIKEKALLLQEIEARRQQSERQLPELLAYQKKLSQAQDELERLRLEQRLLPEELRGWREKGLKLQTMVLDLEQRLAQAREELAGAVHGKAQIEADFKRFQQAWADERGHLLARAQEAEGLQITERQELEAAWQKERILLQSEITRERQNLERRHQEMAEELAKSGSKEEVLRSELVRLAAAEKEADAVRKAVESRLMELQALWDEERGRLVAAVNEAEDRRAAERKANDEAWKGDRLLLELQISKERERLQAREQELGEQLAAQHRAHELALSELQNKHVMAIEALREEQSRRMAEQQQAQARQAVGENALHDIEAKLVSLQGELDNERRRHAEDSARLQAERRNAEESARREMEGKLAALQSQAAAEREQWAQKLDVAIRAAAGADSANRSKLEEQRQIFETKLAEARRQLESAAQQAEERKMALRDERAKAVGDLHAKHKEELARIQEEHGQRLSAMEYAHVRQLADRTAHEEAARRDIEARLAQLQAQWDAERVQWGEKANELAKQLDAASQDSSSVRMSARVELSQSLAQAEAQHQKALAALQEEHARSSSDLTARLSELQKRLDEERGDWAGKLNAALRELEAVREASAKQKVDQAESQSRDLQAIEARHREAIARLQEEHAQRLALVEDELRRAAENRRVREDSFRREAEAKLAQAVGDLQARHQAELAELAGENARKLAEAAKGKGGEDALRKEWEGRLASLQAQWEAERVQWNARFNESIKSIEAAEQEAADRTLALRREHAKALAEMQAAHQNDMAALQKEHSRRLDALQESGGLSLAQRKAVEEAARQEAEAKLAQKQAQWESEKARYAAQLQEAQGQRSLDRKAAEESVAAVRRSLDEALAKIKAAESRHADELLALTERNEKALAAVKQEALDAVKRQQEISKTLDERQERDTASRAAEISSLEASHREAVARLEKSLSDASAARDQARRELEDLRSAARSQRSEQDWLAAIDKMKAELAAQYEARAGALETKLGELRRELAHVSTSRDAALEGANKALEQLAAKAIELEHISQDLNARAKALDDREAALASGAAKPAPAAGPSEKEFNDRLAALEEREQTLRAKQEQMNAQAQAFAQLVKQFREKNG
jgi:hypothetical protein